MQQLNHQLQRTQFHGTRLIPRSVPLAPTACHRGGPSAGAAPRARCDRVVQMQGASQRCWIGGWVNAAYWTFSTCVAPLTPPSVCQLTLTVGGAPPANVGPNLGAAVRHALVAQGARPHQMCPDTCFSFTNPGALHQVGRSVAWGSEPGPRWAVLQSNQLPVASHDNDHVTRADVSSAHWNIMHHK